MTMLTIVDNVNGHDYEQVNGDEYESEDIGEVLMKTILMSEIRNHDIDDDIVPPNFKIKKKDSPNFCSGTFFP